MTIVNKPVVNKNELRYQIQGGITILLKVPDHQPPHVHAYVKVGQEDVIFIKTQIRHNLKGCLSYKQYKICQKWIKENQKELMDKWCALEDMGLIPKPANNNTKSYSYVSNKR